MKNKYIRGIILTIFQLLYLSIIVYAQSGQNNFTSFNTKIVPPAPDAAALGKYGNTPVGLHTGIPQIDIPIYTIKSKTLEVPISLSYHASGNKVDEMASWVGLGWSLNAGGVITRSVVGLADEGGFWSNPIKNSTQITTSDIDYVRGIANGQIDGESDYYFYNFNGHAGKFIYNQNKELLLIPVSPIIVKYILQGSEGWFEVTDETGTFYKFAAIEYMTSGSPNEYNPLFKSSFYLTEITSADGSDKIHFNYYEDKYHSESNTTYSETVGLICNPPSTDKSPNQTKSNGYTTRQYQSLRLREIIFSAGKVEFVRDSTRSDAPFSRLGEIKVFSKEQDGSYKVRKRYSLGEGYFVSGSGVGEKDYRLKLTGVAEKDAQGNSNKSHSFFYNEQTMLPPRGSLAQDWWGYYNGQTNNNSLIPSDTINYSSEGINYPFTIGGGIREPNETAMQACILKRIVYPTGGYTEFDYEPHYYTGGLIKRNAGVSASSGELGNTTDLLQQTVTFTPQNSGWARVSTSCSDVTDADPYFSRVLLREQNAPSYSPYLLEHLYTPYAYPSFDARLDKDFLVYLTAGVTYELKVMSKGHSTSTSLSGAAFSMATLSWEEFTVGTKIAGGLRVKEIRDYEKQSGTPLTKIYKYGLGENGEGVLLIPTNGLSTSKQEIDIQYYWRETSDPTAKCNLYCQYTNILISGRTILELSTLNGAPVVYAAVTVYENSTNAANGKQVFKFDVQEDTFTGTPKAYSNGRFQLNESWRGGDQVWNGVYVGTNLNPIKKTSSEYSIFSSREAKGTKIGLKISLDGTCYPAIDDAITLGHYYYFDYPIYSGIKKLTNHKEMQYSSSTDTLNAVATQTEYKYTNLSDKHQQLSSQITINSQGEKLETKYWYPADYNNSVDNIATLLAKNIIATPVKTEAHRNEKIIAGTINRINTDGKPFEVHQYEAAAAQTPPAHNPGLLLPAGYVKKMDIGYDGSTKNIIRIQPSHNFNTTYLWGYNQQYPVAEVKNGTLDKTVQENAKSLNLSATVGSTGGKTAPPSSPTAFSEKLTLNYNQDIKISNTSWNLHNNVAFDVTISIKDAAGTEKFSHKFLYTNRTTVVTVPALSAGAYTFFYLVTTSSTKYPYGDFTFRVDYKKQELSQRIYYTSFEDEQLLGTGDANAKTGTRVRTSTFVFPIIVPAGTYKLTYCKRAANASTWNYQEQTLQLNGAVPDIPLSSGEALDEVRLYPAGAQMTTYTYDPLVGQTATCDANNLITYYTYDAFGRLSLIKDYNGHILKKYTYKYANQ